MKSELNLWHRKLNAIRDILHGNTRIIYQPKFSCNAGNVILGFWCVCCVALVFNGDSLCRCQYIRRQGIQCITMYARGGYCEVLYIRLLGPPRNQPESRQHWRLGPRDAQTWPILDPWRKTWIHTCVHKRSTDRERWKSFFSITHVCGEKKRVVVVMRALYAQHILVLAHFSVGENQGNFKSGWNQEQVIVLLHKKVTLLWQNFLPSIQFSIIFRVILQKSFVPKMQDSKRHTRFPRSGENCQIQVDRSVQEYVCIKMLQMWGTGKGGGG